MQEVSLERAKEIIAEPVVCQPSGVLSIYAPSGRYQSMVKFTRLLMEAEVQTISEIEAVKKSSHDLVHLSGVHKFRYNMPSMKAEELRTYWTRFWNDEVLLKQTAGLKQYIIDVCEMSAYRAGKSRRPYGLFLGGYDLQGAAARTPWRTPEWYAERKASRPVFAPLTEFYPYISKQTDDEHQFLLAVDALVPKSLPDWSRADICQDMIVAVLAGEVTLDNLRDAVPRYIKWFFKKEPSKYGDLSLDMPLYKGEMAGKTLGEAIAAEYA